MKIECQCGNLVKIEGPGRYVCRKCGGPVTYYGPRTNKLLMVLVGLGGIFLVTLLGCGGLFAFVLFHKDVREVAVTAKADMTAQAFVTQKPKEAKVIWLRSASIHAPKDVEVNLWIRLGIGVMENAFVKRDSPVGKEIWEIFKDGEDHDVLLKLQWTPDDLRNESGSLSYLGGKIEIVGVVK